jgi:hypothetical protein
MESRPLRFGTTIIYAGEVGTIKSISKTDNVNIQLISSGNILTVKKNILRTTRHDKGELIKIKDTYYIIKEIKVVAGDNTPIYNLSFVNKRRTDEINKSIKSTDKNIVSIDKKEQGITIEYLKFVDRYNSTCSFLNKKNIGTFTKLDYTTVDADMGHLFKRCKLHLTQLNKIEYTLKKCHKPELQLRNIYTNPFDFITQEYQIINFDKAEKICDEYRLIIDFKIKIEKWSYDLFLREKNAIYIPKWIYDDELKKFCEKRQQTPGRFVEHINKIIIDKKIDKVKDKFGRPTIYKTTEYLLNCEKKITDLTMDLYFEKEYDIDNERIEEKINLYQEMKRRELVKPEFSLETEQKKGIVNAIKNKLSIITGPPGTGKTEILKCVTFVFAELYKEEHPSSENIRDTEAEDNSEGEDDSEGEEGSNESEEDNSEGEEDECESDDATNKFVNPRTIGLLAPTGLAYVNMQRSQKAAHYNMKISGTCHRTLYHTIPNIKKHKRKCTCDGKCEYKDNIKLFVIDEVSMLDIFVFGDILMACKYFNSRLILLGDVEQLPSIGPGQVLFQLIKSGMFTVTKLTKIKRQSAGGLVNNILKMSNEIIKRSDFVDDSMVLLDIDKFVTPNKEINEREIVELIKGFNLDKQTTKFITNFNKEKFTFNTKVINNILQNRFNPLIEGFEHDLIPSNCKYENGFAFRVKDKIIRTENDYSSKKMRANGEEATILNFDGRNVTIQYSGVEDKEEVIGIDALYENFALNYCVTVHKSQGSQYINVVFLIEPNISFIEKKAIYTAVSRARERCLVISREADFIKLQNEIKKIDYKVSLFMEESDNYEFPK